MLTSFAAIPDGPSERPGPGYAASQGERSGARRPARSSARGTPAGSPARLVGALGSAAVTYEADGHSPFITVVPIDRVPVSSVVNSVRERYTEIYGADPEDRSGWYRETDWNRISFVLGGLLAGGSVLDVGLGAGQFVNSLALSGRFTEVHGVDPTRFDKYIELSEGIRRLDRSVGKLPYDDDQFDAVTCMEVLEHVDEEIFERALSELRRVCRGQLLMTVPFEEPEPISKTHRRRFETPDLLKWFPDADFVLLDRRHTPWALIEEWPRGRPLGSATSPMRVAALEAAIASLQWETRWLRNRLNGPIWRRMYARARLTAGRMKRSITR